MEIIDISMTLSNDMITYEGDPEVKIRTAKKFPKDNIMLSKVSMGLHTGTHVDAPCHFIEGGKTLDKVGLGPLIGLAMVCDLTNVKKSISESDLADCKIRKGDIVLLKTTNSKLQKRSRFSRKFVHLSDGGADYLVDKRIKAVGIDYLSIEEFRSETKYVHKRLLSKRIPIIEGLDLEKAKQGTYTLYCLPVSIAGVEAAPARCILIV